MANGYIEAEPGATAGGEDEEVSVENTSVEPVEEPVEVTTEDADSDTDSEAPVSMLSDIRSALRLDKMNRNGVGIKVKKNKIFIMPQNSAL